MTRNFRRDPWSAGGIRPVHGRRPRRRLYPFRFSRFTRRWRGQDGSRERYSPISLENLIAHLDVVLPKITVRAVPSLYLTHNEDIEAQENRGSAVYLTPWSASCDVGCIDLKYKPFTVLTHPCIFETKISGWHHPSPPSLRLVPYLRAGIPLTGACQPESDSQ